MPRKRGQKNPKKPKVIVKLKTLNNKTRKGKYFYVKETGKPGRYYKKKKGVFKKHALEHYMRSIYSKGGISLKRLAKEKELDKLQKKYPKIEDVLQKGYARNTVENAQALTANGIKTAYMNLLRNKDKVGDGYGVVRDALLNELLCRPTNRDKWKQRVLFQIILRNKSGETLSVISNTTVKTLVDVKKEVIGEIKIGQDYEGQYRGIKSSVEPKGYKVSQGTTMRGKINDIRIRMTFKK